MLKLSSAISGWRPAEAAAREPLVLLEASWGEIVGEQVAQNSHPARIAGDTLQIVTRSNAWSNQLTLLSEHVLRAVGARLPNSGVRQLRFRVGTLPRRSAPPALRRPSARVHDPGVRTPSATPAEALGRFRQEVERSHRAKRAEGWRPCLDCGALVAPEADERCAACVVAAARRRTDATARLLSEAPWLGYAGTAKLVCGLKEEEYEGVRSQLLSRWWGTLVRARDAKRLSRDGRERLIASSYVLLRSKIPPEEILPATVRSVLGDELHDLIYMQNNE